MLTVGSLFSGIGGFDLGLERAGMRTVWFCEQDPFCQRVLAKHWPGVPVHPDVRALVADTDSAGLRRVAQLDGTATERQRPTPRRGDTDGRTDPQRRHGATGNGGDPADAATVPVPVPYVDVLCGGFPCQDISVAGRGAGIQGERSGLWGEYARLVRELRPRYVLVENVSALLARGMGRVLRDLAACGYDAEWDCIPASAVGAPHRRDRVWLVAYPQGDGRGPGGPGRPSASGAREREPVGTLQVADAAWDVRTEPASGGAVGERARQGGERGREGALADADDAGRGVRRRPVAVRPQLAAPERGREGWRDAGDWWLAEPDVGRVAHGIPARVDRLRSLGNALVPQIAEWLGRRILEWEGLT